MIDIGANLSNRQFDYDLKEVFERALRQNVSHIVLTATDLKTFFRNKKIIKDFGHIIPLYNTLGLHPHHASQYKDFFIQFDKLMQSEKIISIGEFGLDYFRMISPKQDQLNAMNIFMDKAKNYSQPLFLHERDAAADFISILKNHSVENKKVVHCFTGNTVNLKKYLDLGCYIGITGWCTERKRGFDVRKAIEFIPLDKLMIETDAPYLTPRNMKEDIKRNEPSFLYWVAKEISILKKVPISSVIEFSYKNSMDFFNLSPYNNIKVDKIKNENL